MLKKDNSEKVNSEKGHFRKGTTENDNSEKGPSENKQFWKVKRWTKTKHLNRKTKQYQF